MTASPFENQPTTAQSDTSTAFPLLHTTFLAWARLAAVQARSNTEEGHDSSDPQPACLAMLMYRVFKSHSERQLKGAAHAEIPL
jgi:hypothetical protein